MHKCKLCSRKFSSGKAMGGHMRSHLMTLPLPPKTPPQKQDSSGHNSESTLSHYSSKQQEENDSLGAYGLRETPKKSVDPDQCLYDRESETESTKKPTRRRSKRIRRVFGQEEIARKKVIKSVEAEPMMMSSFSDSSPEEDIAICLMMLSKDVWRNNHSHVLDKSKGKCYKCEICNKVLKSSQALGSHKTIHKKKKNSDELEEKQIEFRVTNNVDQKVHECPFCGKIYGSGQALGGHKRSHILSSSIAASSSSSAKFPIGFIDLNMPAPIDDEDFSQLEVSGFS